MTEGALAAMLQKPVSRAELPQRLREWVRALRLVTMPEDGFNSVNFLGETHERLCQCLLFAADCIEFDREPVTASEAAIAAKGTSAEGPVIQFDYDCARHFVTIAMRELALRPEESLEAAVAAYCTEENLREQIARCVVDVIAQVTRQEVERYYRDGAGREIVVDAAMAVLRQRREEDAERT